MSKTAKGLVDFAKKALKENWGYCLGTYGSILTPAYLKQKQNQAGRVGEYNTRQNAYLQKFINKRVSDCYGLVKGFLWWQGENKNPKYNRSQDRNQEMAYNAAKEKGPLSTLPEIPGVILWMKGHAGIYIGNGEFIECVGAPVGMRKGRIEGGRVVSGSKFTHWFKDTFIDYSDAPAEKPKPAPEKPSGPIDVGSKVEIKQTAKKYSTGENIPAKYKGKEYTVQQVRGNRALIKELYSWVDLKDLLHKTQQPRIAEDGLWGPETTRAMQRALGTVVDGIISGQYKNDITRQISSVDYSHKRGSDVVEALQRKVGAKPDRYLGPETIRAAQKYFGTIQDGYLSRPSMLVREMQRRLNQGTF